MLRWARACKHLQPRLSLDTMDEWTTSEPQVLRIPEAMRRLPRVGCGAIGLVQMISMQEIDRRWSKSSCLFVRKEYVEALWSVSLHFYTVVPGANSYSSRGFALGDSVRHGCWYLTLGSRQVQVSHTSMILSPPVDQLYRHYADGLLCQRFPIAKAKNQ